MGYRIRDATTEHNVHLRAYRAGVGATTALTSGALVVFLSLATAVAFKGLTSGGWSNAGAAYLDSTSTSAVAKNAAPGSHVASPAARSGGGGFASDGSSGRGSTGPSGGSADPGGPGAISRSGPVLSTPSVSTPPGGINPPPINVPSVPNRPGGINPPPINVPSVPNRPGGINPPLINVPSVPNVPNVPNVP